MSADGELRKRLEGLFREELQDNLRLLIAGLDTLEREPGADAAMSLVPELFRAAHSLKGAAHSAGVVPAVEPCRRLEDSLARLRDGELVADGELLAELRAEVEALIALEHQLAAGDDSDSGETTTPHVTADPDVRVEDAGPSTTSPALRARVSVEDLDDLVAQVGTLISGTQRLHLLADELTTARDAPRGDGHRSPRSAMGTDLLERVTTEVGAVGRALGHATRRVAGAAQQLRMQRLDDVATGLDHAVAEVARSTGTQALLVVTGGDVTVDRDIGDALREPLLHLVRNAVDHGIETPEERLRVGKAPVGTVQVEATLEGGRVRITVADDGRGVDVAALAAAAAARGAPTDEGLELAFRPGVSTASSVTDISGRGVGLDAVRVRVETLGGTVHLRARPSPEDGGWAGGTEVVLHVPTTLAVLRIVLVAVGDEAVAIPAESVQRVHRVEAGSFERLEGRLLLMDGDRPRPAVVLGATLGFPVEGIPTTVLELVDEEGVLLVDRVEAELEVLLQPLPPKAAGSRAALGAVLLPSERTAIVVHPAACLRAGSAVATPLDAPAPRPQPVVLLAEDTLTTRALEHSILAGAGYEVVDAVDGTDAWRLLAERPVDLVVSDVDMPGMGGIALCRAIRASGSLGDIPVVLVTSLASDEDRRRGVEAGANAYLVKSAFDQATLLEAVRRLL